MSPRIVECEQGSVEWHAARCGKVTASRLSDMMAGGAGKMRSGYMRQLAGEIVTELPMEETFRSKAMDRGKEMEEEIATLYAVVEDVDIQRVGFVVNDGLIKGRTIGASPDRLVGERGAVEVKSEKPDNLILRYKGEMTSGAEHLAQCQGILWVTERDWIDLVWGYRKMPNFKRRIFRDAGAIKRIEIACAAFLDELDKMVEWVRIYQQ